MGRTRAVAVQLARKGRIQITQRGQMVAVEEAGEIKGPIRLRAAVMGRGDGGGGGGSKEEEDGGERAGGDGC